MVAFEALEVWKADKCRDRGSVLAISTEFRGNRKGKGDGCTYTHHRDNTPITLAFVLLFNCSLLTRNNGIRHNAKSTAQVTALYAYADFKVKSSATHFPSIGAR